MSLPVLIAALIPLFLSPFWTDHLFRRLHRREQVHIAVDNAGIRLGKNDRDLFNHLKASNKLMLAMDLVHDGLHAAARVPLAGATAVAEDLAMETTMAIMHQTAFAVAQAEWLAGSGKVLGALAQQETALLRLDRNLSVPIKGHRCKFCYQEVAWEVSQSEVSSTIEGMAESPRPVVKVSLAGKSLLRGEKWDYRLSLPH
jgi:hypothetical protein